VLKTIASLEVVPAGGDRFGQPKLHGALAADLEEMVLARLEHLFALFPAIGLRRDLRFGHVRPIARLLVLHAVHDHVPIDHGFGQCRGPPLGSGEVADLLCQVGDELLLGVPEHELLIHEDGARVAQHRPGTHDNLIASQRGNGRTADRLPGHVGHDVGEVQVTQPCGNVQARVDQPAAAVDLHHHEVGPLPPGDVQLAVEVLLQSGADQSLETYEHAA